MATKARVQLMDRSMEATSVNFYVPELTNANYDAVVAAIDALETAALLITDCSHVNTSFSHVTEIASFAVASEHTAQREIGLRVTYRDTVNGKVGSFIIPGPTEGAYPNAGTDVIPLDNVVAAAFILVFEANAVSRDGNAVEVVQIRFVGRSN